jgi:hypothetical protein
LLERYSAARAFGDRHPVACASPSRSSNRARALPGTKAEYPL